MMKLSDIRPSVVTVMEEKKAVYAFKVVIRLLGPEHEEESLAFHAIFMLVLALVLFAQEKETEFSNGCLSFQFKKPSEFSDHNMGMTDCHAGL